MKKVIIASKNPVKINAALLGFQKMFPEDEFEVEGISVSSGVSNQPMTDKETFLGAKNRAKSAILENKDADFWVGIEGGVEEKNREIEAFAWVYIESKEKIIGKAKTGTFFLPAKIAELIKEGKELGEANDLLFKEENSKQKGGAIGILTGNVIDRTGYYVGAVVSALIPFKNKNVY